VTLRQLLWVARPSLNSIVVTRRASNSSSWSDTHHCSQTVAGRLGSRPDFDSHIKEGYVLLTSKSFQALRRSGAIPRSIELNIVDLRCLRPADSSSHDTHRDTH